jgi:hypothetical protein
MARGPDLAAVRWYFDESLLGVARILSDTRDDVIYPGHPLVPELPLGIADIDWIPRVARADWVALVRDRRIRTRTAEASAFQDSGLRIVFFGGKRDLRPADQGALFIRHLPRLEREVTKRGRGPWGLVLTQTGLAPLKRRN